MVRQQHNSQSSTVKRQLLPLESGDRLTRPEFERRYLAAPHIKKAELIEGAKGRVGIAHLIFILLLFHSIKIIELTIYLK